MSDNADNKNRSKTLDYRRITARLFVESINESGGLDTFCIRWSCLDQPPDLPKLHSFVEAVERKSGIEVVDVELSYFVFNRDVDFFRVFNCGNNLVQ